MDANFMDKARQIFAQFGQEPPAHPADQQYNGFNPETDLNAPESEPGYGVLLDKKDRAPQFRDQKNAHDAEVAQIEQAINGIEQAQANDRHANSSARIGELGLRAGQAVSSQMGGLPITEKGPLTPKISEGDQKLQATKQKETMKQDLFKRENPEEERMNKLQIEQYKELLKRQEDADAAARHEKDQTQKHEDFLTGQTGQDRRAAAGNTTRIAAAEIAAGGSSARGVGEAAAKNEYEQAKMGSKRTFDGVKYHAREMVDMNQSNRADHVLETYSMLMPALDELQDALKRDPRGVTKWGSDARAGLVAAVQQAAEGTTKYNGDGVMNGADQEHAMRQLGSPEAFEQMLTANGGAGLSQFKKTIQLQLHSRLQSLGYEPGEGKDNSLEGAHKRAGAAGGAASAKTPRVSAQDALDAADASMHGKKATLNEINPPAAVAPRTEDIPPKKDDKKGAAGKTIVWKPGQKARVE